MEINNYTNDALELLKELITIPSVTRKRLPTNWPSI